MKVQTLMSGLLYEIERNSQLFKDYMELPQGVGVAGAALIRFDLGKAKAAIESGDLPEMIKAYKALEGNK